MLELRYRLSALVASEYADAGFNAVVQDNIYGEDVVRWLATIKEHPKHLVVLRPRVQVVEQREVERRQRSGKVAYRGGFTPADNDRALARTPRDLGLWLDTSEQDPNATVDEMLSRSAEALLH